LRDVLPIIGPARVRQETHIIENYTKKSLRCLFYLFFTETAVGVGVIASSVVSTWRTLPQRRSVTTLCDSDGNSLYMDETWISFKGTKNEMFLYRNCHDPV